MNAQESSTPARTADPSTLRYTATNGDATRYSVWLDTPGTPVIGAAQFHGGRWIAYPLGGAPATEPHHTLDLAGHALIERVPTGAVYLSGSRWITAEQITPATARRCFGLPILTADQMRKAQMHFMHDADDLVLPEEAAAPLAPCEGQAVIVDQGTVYWFIANGDGSNLSGATVIAQAPVAGTGFVDWGAATVEPLELDGAATQRGETIRKALLREGTDEG